VGLARRFVLPVPARAAIALALLPLLFTGEALILGRLYGPADLYATAEPWKTLAAERGAPAPSNSILSDLAFANLPWRAAVRESVANGRLPLWNRFVLAGNPLLGAAQAGILHPATWLALWLPVPLSFTFSCAFTLFLALLTAFLFFADLRLPSPAALVGAIGWGFSTYMLFWLGWSVGPSTATWPLLLLGLRRLAREPGLASISLTAAALWLSLCGGHPESFFHGVAAGGVYFLWELAGVRSNRHAGRAVGASLAAGVFAVCLSGPQLFPLLEAIPHTAEYRHRREAVSRGESRQSVPAREAVRRMRPHLLPFAHGIFGKSPVQTVRGDGSGMPLGYAGAVLFPLAAIGLAARPPDGRGRGIFAAFLGAGLLFGASAPILHDLTDRLPVFALALNYRLVFLAALGLAGLSAFGVAALAENRVPRKKVAFASGAVGLVLVTAFQIARPVFEERILSPDFVGTQFLYEVVPLALLGLAAVFFPVRGFVTAVVVLLCAQRYVEMRGVYPTLPAGSLAPALPGLEAASASAPARIVATGTTFRPNAGALYRLEDVRGYESLVLDRFAETFPMWCRAQSASFNLVTRLDVPFLALLNVRYAVGSPGEPPPAGWRERARTEALSVFENPRALPRAFVPEKLRFGEDPARRLGEMAEARDFARTAWLSGGEAGSEKENGRAELEVRAVGPDLLVTADVSQQTLVATSLPDWPGWKGETGDRELSLTTVNHAFVGFWLPPGRSAVRLTYRPHSFTLGLWAFAAASAAGLGLAWPALRRRRSVSSEARPAARMSADSAG
jgi:hypothetical protein